MILVISHCGERGENVTHHRMFMNIIGMAKALWCGQALCTMAEHRFISLSKVPLNQRYFREIILGHVRLFRSAVDPDFLFIDDNARPHRTAEVSDTFKSENIECME